MHSNGRPETVYELCEQTCEAIRMRPLNYYQESWITPASCITDAKGNGNRHKEACGTAYCRAGWMAAILSNTALKPDDASSTNIASTLPSSILRAAGVPYSDVSELFAGGSVERKTNAPAGSARYVKAGIAGMKELMQRYEPQLKAARINPDNTVTVMGGTDGSADATQAEVP